MNHSLCALLLFVLAAVLVGSAALGSGYPVFQIRNAREKPDFDHLPRFYTSDSGYDAFVNEWFMRHLCVDDSGIYTGWVKPGLVDVLWTIEWDWWMLPWIDRGAMGLQRQFGQRNDNILTTLSNAVVDKYGYTWGCRVWLEPRNHVGGWVPTFGWPWPKYNRNYTVKRPTGWEFNDTADGARDEWLAHDIDIEPGYVDHSLVGTINGPKPEFISPKFDCEAFQIPIIELDITYRREAISGTSSRDTGGGNSGVSGTGVSGTCSRNGEAGVGVSGTCSRNGGVGVGVSGTCSRNSEVGVGVSGTRSRNSAVADAVNGLRIYWTTDQHPRFSEDRMVTVDFCDLPPNDFPDDHAPNVNDKDARYLLFFPMYLHPEWGRESRRITRLKIVPSTSGAEGTIVMLNFVRASYDVRMHTTNSVLINATHKFYMFNGDDRFLAYQMPRLRRAMLFMLEHMKGRKEGLICTDWMVGKDGLGGDQVGHGQIASYWDLMPAGRFDMESSMYFYHALRSLAELERVVARECMKVPEVSVIGPDNHSTITYHETPKSLDALAARVKRNIEERFWIKDKRRFCRNIDANGVQHDYGWLQFNLQALAFGIGTDEQRQAIVSWLNGRAIPGDTSTGADIYHWRFGPRTTTVQNDDYYFWPWVFDRRNFPEAAKNYVFGNQYQNGGAAPFTSTFDLMARCSTGDQKDIDGAFKRTLEIREWYEDVKSAGGKGPEFYRAYYNDHPDRGLQQSPSPGGLGLDHEFLSDAAIGTIFIYHAFLGVDSSEDGIIDICPAVPSQVRKIGVTNVFYRGNYLRIEAGRGYVSLEGSDISNGQGLKARVTFRNAPRGAKVFVDGRPATRVPTSGGVQVVTDLRAVRVEFR